MQNITDLGISALDLIALAWFVTTWFGYVVFTHYRCDKKTTGIVAEMNLVRLEWALELLERDNRMMDSQVINSLINKATFFASTTILIVASVLALMSVGDEVFDLFENIPFAQKTSNILWMLKVLVLVMVFMFAFFKFTWAIRQHSICATLMASIPSFEHSDTPKAQLKARQLAKISSLASNLFNDGLRAYYFAVAELSWFYHPLAFMFATTWVAIVLYRREYHSKAHAILSNKELPNAEAGKVISTS